MDTKVVIGIVVAFAAPLAAVVALNFEQLAGPSATTLPEGKLLYFYANT
jgi:hypothetical protein